MALMQYSSISVGDRKTSRTMGRRYQALVLFLLTSLALLGGVGSRLAYLQLVEGTRNSQLAENNRIRLVPKRPARGTIFDRNGKILAGSRLSRSVSLWPIAVSREEWPPVIERLANILDIPPDEIQRRLEQAGYDSIESVPLTLGITPAQVIAIAEYSDQLPGVRIEAEAVRNYPSGDMAAHVLGYTGEMDDSELAARSDEGYRLGDFTGKMGAESAFESRLRGEWGGQQVEVDSAGRVVGILGSKPAISGQDVQLTLDLELQRAAEDALGDTTGTLIALDPRNGAVLAMVSRPAFDPNIFTTNITDAQWAQLQSARFPFLNRSLQSYPPASTFKIVTAAAAIESGNYSPNAVLPTYPYVTSGGIQFWDWNRAGFGSLGFPGALSMSSNTFFYQTAMRMGEQPLIQWSRRFGFGQRTGIELGSEESAGLVPDEAWKEAELGEGWYQGDTITMAIGQSFMQATPLQIAVMFSIIANGGYDITPHLLKDGNQPTRGEPIGLSEGSLRVIRQGLREGVVRGTGRAGGSANMPAVAGKSGTAQAPPYQNHAWFGAFAPYEDPEIVVVGFGEHAGSGGGALMAPKTREVMEAYFQLQQSRQGGESEESDTE